MTEIRSLSHAKQAGTRVEYACLQKLLAVNSGPNSGGTAADRNQGRAGAYRILTLVKTENIVPIFSAAYVLRPEKEAAG
jgi:hypothetical protein